MKGEHFRYCSIDSLPDDTPVGPESPLLKRIAGDVTLDMYCYNREKCPEHNGKIAEIRKHDRMLLEESCKEAGVEHVPKDADPSIQQMFGTYCQILAKNYPVKEFDDRGRIRRMPFTIKYGIEIPIVCAASVIAQRKFSTATQHLLMQEGADVCGEARTDHGKFDIPGGGLEWGESFESCAVREFEEEIGLTPQLEKLVGVVERINQNRKLVVKAVYTGSTRDTERRQIHDDSIGFAYFGTEAVRMLSSMGLLKTSDAIILVNRVEEGMLFGLDELCRENSRIRMGWDRAWE
jgi:ADP-ribose pyrophosphatase YjhB (NUDIX family)